MEDKQLACHTLVIMLVRLNTTISSSSLFCLSFLSVLTHLSVYFQLFRSTSLFLPSAFCFLSYEPLCIHQITTQNSISRWVTSLMAKWRCVCCVLKAEAGGWHTNGCSCAALSWWLFSHQNPETSSGVWRSTAGGGESQWQRGCMMWRSFP